MKRNQRHNLAVYAHPGRASFNHALLTAATDALVAQGETVEVSDLYADAFEPTLTAAELSSEGQARPEVRREQARVACADRLLFFYPIWWYDRPAILKGWCDRILRPGFAYQVDPAGVPRGLLGAKSASIVVTLGAEEGQCSTAEFTGAMARGTLEFCGVTEIRTLPLFGVPSASEGARRRMIDRVAAWVCEL